MCKQAGCDAAGDGEARRTRQFAIVPRRRRFCSSGAARQHLVRRVKLRHDQEVRGDTRSAARAMHMNWAAHGAMKAAAREQCDE